MQSVELTPEKIKGYPELATALLHSKLDLIRRLPLPFASLLMREAIGYDWKFPVERREIESDFVFLSKIEPARFHTLMAPFRSIRLSADLQSADWVSDPIGFAEKLSAHLWATHQIDQFRSAAVEYMNERTSAMPAKLPALSRFTCVLIGEGAAAASVPVFRKLRPHGTFYSNVQPDNGLSTLFGAVAERSAAHREPFAHWYIDGGVGASDLAPTGVASISYGGLAGARAAIQRELKASYESRIGSEAMRSQLAQKKPEDLGLKGTGDDAVLNRFALSILTEGSGTQIYSTTFVQWAVREALRRAQPVTMLARFRPRQRERPMQDLLLETQRAPDLDPVGSLLDADMGAYYTWINQQRLPGADKASFLVWFEGRREALAIGPSVDRASSSDAEISMEDLSKRLIQNV
ncbi:MAG TPA: hypothetical protein VEQ63_13315 [Bryobacteraceae bacterium]|nr:hypothetical protein [Bryobacteraceae bacterium]